MPIQLWNWDSNLLENSISWGGNKEDKQRLQLHTHKELEVPNSNYARVKGLKLVMKMRTVYFQNGPEIFDKELNRIS